MQSPNYSLENSNYTWSLSACSSASNCTSNQTVVDAVKASDRYSLLDETTSLLTFCTCLFGESNNIEHLCDVKSAIKFVCVSGSLAILCLEWLRAGKKSASLRIVLIIFAVLYPNLTYVIVELSFQDSICKSPEIENDLKTLDIATTIFTIILACIGAVEVSLLGMIFCRAKNRYAIEQLSELTQKEFFTGFLGSGEDIEWQMVNERMSIDNDKNDSSNNKNNESNERNNNNNNNNNNDNNNNNNDKHQTASKTSKSNLSTETDLGSATVNDDFEEPSGYP